jgi:adenylylsulfate kinase-like enzyme
MAKIYWFTGKPGVGKSVLAGMLTDFLSTEKRNWRSKVFLLDDNYFDTESNLDYNQQTQIAQTISHFINQSGCDVVVSLISPDKNLREEFKNKLGNSIIEFHVHSNKIDSNEFDIYEPPIHNFFDVDTTKGNHTNSFNKIIHYLRQ